MAGRCEIAFRQGTGIDHPGRCHGTLRLKTADVRAGALGKAGTGLKSGFHDADPEGSDTKALQGVGPFLY